MGEVMIGVLMVTAGLIISAYPIIKLIGWALDGGIDPAMAIFGALLYLCLIAGIMGAPGIGKIILLLFLLASAILMPVFGKVNEQVQNTRIEDGKFNQLAAALERDPMDAPVRMEFARMLRKRGELNQAIEHMEWTLNQYPKLGYRVKTELDTWKREQERVGVPQPIFCHRCHTENPWNATNCYQCGAAFGTKAGIKQRVAQEGGPQKVIRGWIVTATALNIVCFTLLYGALYLPAPVVASIILATVIVAAWLFLRWIGGDMGTVGE